jgi:hypothetical protein
MAASPPNERVRFMAHARPACNRRLSFETLCDRRVMENHAPVLDTSGPAPELRLAATSGGSGTTVDEFAGIRISDVDAGAVKGIAVIDLTERGPNQGFWQYRLSGSALWRNISSGESGDPLAGRAPSDSEALVLGPNDAVRYIAQSYYRGTPQLKFRAWDQTDAAVRGSIVDTTGKHGGEDAYSIDFRSARAPIYGRVPVITIDGTLKYRLGDAPAPIAPRALVTDTATDSFAGGSLTVHLTEFDTNNRLGYSGDFFLDGNRLVVHNDTVIGKQTSDVSGTSRFPLVIEFSAAATTSVVQELVRSITFQRLKGSLNDLQVRFFLTDSNQANGPEASKNIKVGDTTRTTPVINMGGTVGYQRNDPAAAIAPNATITNTIVDNFAGGTLTVSLNPRGASNTLAIGGPFVIGASTHTGDEVKLNGRVIGYRVRDGIGTHVLEIKLGPGRITRAETELLIRSITYQNLSGSAGKRTATFSLHYADQESIGTKTISVS